MNNENMLCPPASLILLALFPLPLPPPIFQRQTQEAFLDAPSFLWNIPRALFLLF